MQEPIEVVELAERNSRAAAEFSLSNLDEARKRAHALLLVLLAGASGAGALGLAQVGIPPVSAAALGVSVFWYLLAGVLAWYALRSDPVRAWATPGLLGSYPKWRQYSDEVDAETGWRPDVVIEMRKVTVRNSELAASEYRKASTRTMKTVDAVYRAAAFTPLCGAAAAGVAYFLG